MLHGDFDMLMDNLSVIGSLSVNDKINTLNDQFCISPPSTYRNLYRLMLGESRAHNMRRIKACVDGTKLHILWLYNARARRPMRERQLDVMSALAVSDEDSALLRVNTRIRECLNGLENLRQTYRDDMTVFVHLTNLMESVTHLCSTCSALANTDASESAYAKLCSDPDAE